MYSRDSVDKVADRSTYNDSRRSMAMDLVCDLQRSASTLGYFDFVLLIRFEIPVCMRILRVRKHFSCSKRRRSLSTVCQFVRLARVCRPFD